MRRITPIAAFAAVALTGFGLAGCGSNTTPGGTGSAENTSDTATSGQPSSGDTGSMTDATDSASPPSSASKPAGGTLAIGTDASYEPNEFQKPGNPEIQGMDVDLFNAVAAKLGYKTKWQNGGFDTLISGVAAGKYQVAVSSFSITAERMKQVNMVSYFIAGTQWAVKKGNPSGINPDDIKTVCGKTVGVQIGTTQQDELNKVRQPACKKAGLPEIKVVPRQGQDQVTSDLATGKTQAMLADSPVCLYAIKQAKAPLEAVGKAYDTAPYGIVVPKKNTKLAQDIAKALGEMKKDGSYDKILAKWGNGSGGLKTFELNPKQ